MDLVLEVMEEGPEPHGGQAQRHHRKNDRQQGGTLPLADLREADAGKYQQDGRKKQRPVPGFFVAQKVKGCKFVEGTCIHLHGNAQDLGHGKSLLFRHRTIFFSNKQGESCKIAAKHVRIRH